MNLDVPRPSLPSSPRLVSRPVGRLARLVRLLSRLMRAPMLAVVSQDRIVYRGLRVSTVRDLVGLVPVMAVGRVVSISNPRALPRLAGNALVRDGVRFVGGLSSRHSDGRLVSLLVLDARLRGPLSRVERALLEEFMPLIADALETESHRQTHRGAQLEPGVIPSAAPELVQASSPESSVLSQAVPGLEAPGVVFESVRWNGARFEGRFRLVESRRAPDLADLLTHADLSLLEVDLGGVITGFVGIPRAGLGLGSDEVIGRSVFEVCAEWPGLTLSLNRAIEGETVTSLLRTEPRLELRAVPVRWNELIVGALAVLWPVLDESDDYSPVQYGVDSPAITFKRPLLTNDGSYASRLKVALASAEAALEEAQSEAVGHERQRIARELHDGLGKDLFGLAMLLESVAERQQGRAIQGELLGYASIVRRLGNEGRALLESFRQSAPPSLATRLRALASGLEAAGMVRVQLDLPADLPELNPHALHELSRVLEEAFENIHRHAQARHAWVVVRLGSAWLEFTVEDDGRGLPEVMPAGRFGLVGMRERVELLGGGLRVGRSLHGGVRLEARFPLAGLTEVPDVHDP